MTRSDLARASPQGPIRYLGIDPGLNRTGYALLERSPNGPILCEGGVIRSTGRLSLAERILEICSGLCEILDAFGPESMAIEQVFSVTRYPKSALLLAHARGGMLFAAAERGIPVVDYTPTQIKRRLTGSGRASKEQIQRAVQMELGLKHVLKPNDVADAFAVALCHYYRVRIAA